MQYRILTKDGYYRVQSSWLGIFWSWVEHCTGTPMEFGKFSEAEQLVAMKIRGRDKPKPWIVLTNPYTRKDFK